MSIFLLVGVMAMFFPTIVATTEWWIPASVLVLAMINALFIAQLAHRSGLTRMPSAVPAFLYLVTLGANTSLHTLWKGQVVLMVLLIVLQLMQRTYHQDEATEESFLATVLLLIASFLWTDILVFLAVWMLLLVLEENIGFRTIGAMVVASAMLGVYCLLAWQMGWFVPDWTDFTQRHWISADGSITQMVDIILLCFSVYLVIASFFRITRDNISIQKYLQMVTVVLLSLICIYVFPMCVSMSEALIPAVTAMAASVYFLSTKTLPRGIIFSVYVLIMVCEFVFNVVILR